ncbi:MAG TPA: N-acetylmuramoyl-L-alanine amidase [Terriglobales bacterium]|nr:N-acetylmuramoyl-L-alanine amidase [Terriglobales bacterium]
MSATPKNAGAGWGPPQLLSPPVTQSPAQTSAQAPSQEGQDALQVLLAFACIHEQAVQRRRLNRSGVTLELAADEFFGLDDVLRLVAARAMAITGADGVAVALARENAIVCRASIGKIAPDPGVRLDPNSGFSGACLRNGQTVRCDDSETDSRVNAQACRALGTRSMVAVPLMARARVIGLIEAFSSETHGFNESDVKSLNLLGELILAAIHPEEEDRLAQLAEQILPKPPEVQVAKPPEVRLPPVEVQTPIPVATSTSNIAEPVHKVPAPSALVIEVPVPAVPVTDTPRETVCEVRDNKLDLKRAPLVADVPEVATESPAAKPETAPAPIPMPVLSFPDERRSLKRVLLVAALVLVAVGLGWAWLRHAEQLTSANTRQLTPFTPASESTPNADSSQNIKEPEPPAQPALQPGATPEVTGIRHWSSADSSTVVVDLQDQVQYETHTLDNPPRVYFDLIDTKMAPGLLNQSIVVDDAFIKRVRMAEPTSGVTRVVLDTKGVSEISVKLDPSPYRLTIDVHKPPTGPVAAPLTKPSPSMATSPKKNSRVAASASEFRVVLDAGHGGWDLGTVGRKGLLEKDLTLDIVQRLGKLIEGKLGADVIYTRQDDTYLPLEKRAEIANLTHADLFLSVHANYSDLETARGVETYYTTTYSSIKARTAEDDPTLKDVNWTGVDIREKVTNSHRLAADVQQALFGTLSAEHPAIRNRGVKEAQYVVLTGTQMPAVLAEVSFVSSPVDEDNLESSTFRQQIAEALYRGVARYRSETRHTKLASAKN